MPAFHCGHVLLLSKREKVCTAFFSISTAPCFSMKHCSGSHGNAFCRSGLVGRSRMMSFRNMSAAETRRRPFVIFSAGSFPVKRSPRSKRKRSGSIARCACKVRRFAWRTVCHVFWMNSHRAKSRSISPRHRANNVDFFFRHLRLHAWFARERVAFNDGTVRGKPAPDIYRRAAQNLGMDVRDCIVFEDSKSGVEAAKRASARKVVGVSSASAPSRLRLWGADEIIADYTRPDEIFEKIGMP